MIKKRPLNINPLSIQLPIGALVSITHRLSGILVFLLIPLLLWALQRSLASPEGLNQVKDCLSGPICKTVVWIFLAGLSFHLVAGLRHVLMDLHVADSLLAARRSAKLVIIIFIALAVGAAFWIGR